MAQTCAQTLLSVMNKIWICFDLKEKLLFPRCLALALQRKLILFTWQLQNSMAKVIRTNRWFPLYHKQCVLCVFRQIMSLSNSLMYEGRLECGSERTATALLTLPFVLSVQSELSSYSKTHPQHDLAWIQPTLLPSNPVCFLDCSTVGKIFSARQAVVFDVVLR